MKTGFSSMVLCLFTASILVGCSASRHDNLADLGFATPYLEGYDDGCHSKVTAAQTHTEGFRQDPERMYKSDRYASGWNDGFEQCFVASKHFH
ncbi:hypothetical protein [Enterovibrio nigricans]|uniref:Lipoprotein n=1 Tax=Enterovibrio nigricans DSM 22720 TaxID=1121868 RepID=A0A1T4VLR0_9GAMM|nr:hypothetical protein [Enterovibrio nigricans]PKF49483.1 hypothetical protein AT251_18455 [Enterovibrio nigricans]SKA65857.1 hypothetical protein SAMN02745132_04010 [Enterovibrio nigricans DSM 22720]